MHVPVPASVINWLLVKSSIVEVVPIPLIVKNVPEVCDKTSYNPLLLGFVAPDIPIIDPTANSRGGIATVLTVGFETPATPATNPTEAILKSTEPETFSNLTVNPPVCEIVDP